MTVTGTRPRAPHLGPERRRPLLLDAARSVAIREGIGAVTVGAVAKESGIARSVLYRCFSDRVEMVEELLDREMKIVVDAVLVALRSSGGFDGPEEAFRSGFRALLTTVDAHPDSFRFLVTSEPDVALSKRFSQARAQVSDAATTWMQPAIVRWWNTDQLDHKLPLLIEFFMVGCETAIRKHLDGSTGWSGQQIADFTAAAYCRVFAGA